MIETIKSIILDLQEMRLETGVPRRLRIETVHGKAAVCIGVRRGGKSTYLFQVIQRLLDGGVPRKNILYLNFFDDRLHNLRQGNLGLIAEAYYSIYPEKKNTEMVYHFFDEIQAAQSWEPFVDRVMRTEKCEVYLTGSSARMLSKEIATLMRGGRFRGRCSRSRSGNSWTTKEPRARVRFRRKSNSSSGRPSRNIGRPAASPRSQALAGTCGSRPTRNTFTPSCSWTWSNATTSHPKAVTDLAHWLVDNTASLYSINSLTGYLKSLGHKAPKSAVSDYLEWFEDAYFLFTVRIFDASLARRDTNPKRVYCVDHAMVTSVSSGILVNSGHLLENLVFTALRRLHPEIYYYKTKTGREVDFIVPLRGRPRMLVPVCESLAEPQTRKRETAALGEAMAELGLQTGAIVARNEEERIDLATGTIEVVPAWRFLLDLPESTE